MQTTQTKVKGINFSFVFSILALPLSRLNGVISHGRVGKRAHGRGRRTNLLRDAMREL